MAYGKTIEMFLIDGTAAGMVTAELSNWNGKAIKIPRTEVPDCKRDDIQGVGIYFLFCTEEDGEESVYIGESENILKRLKQHILDYKAGNETYYWNTAVAFTGGDLNKALIRYLENRLVEIARSCKRNKVLTKASSLTPLKESQIASMEEFIDNIETLLGALGYRVLTPVQSTTVSTEYLYCKGNSSDAKGYVSAGGFTVLAGSRVSDHVPESFKRHGASYFRLREELQKSGVIENGVFQQDYEFSAPSAASAVVLARRSNGRKDWKTVDGTPLGEL